MSQLAVVVERSVFFMNTTNSELITALYCRFSKDDYQLDDNISIVHQKQILLEYAEKQGFPNPQFYIDDGYTGTNFNRPDFRRMIDDIKAGKIGIVITKDLSRFGREYTQTGAYIEIVFPLYSVRYIAIGDDVDTALGDAGGNEMMPFKNVFNEHYSRECSKKIKAVINFKGNAGKHLANTPPYGYIKNPENKEEWILDEVAAPIVAEIFKMLLGGTSVTDIAYSLEVRKVLTPTAHKQHYGIVKATVPVPKEKRYKWSPETVGNIIDNEAYMGITVNFKTHSVSFKNKTRIKNDRSEQKVFDDTHPAIVDKETWGLAQGRRRTRQRPTKMGELNMLSGYLYCADCGSRMTLHRAVGKSYEYYYCSKYRAKSKSHECTSHIVRADVVEKLLLENIRSVVAFVRGYENEFVKLVSSSTNTEQGKQIKALNKSIAKAQKRLTELENNIAALYEDKVAGAITVDMFNQLSRKFTDEQTELKASLSNDTATLSEVEQTKADVGKFVKTVKQYTEINELTPELLAEFINKVLIHQSDKSSGKRKQQIDIYFKGVGKVELA